MSTALPAALVSIPRLPAGSAAQTRDFVLGGNDQNPTINGQSMTSMSDLMDMSRSRPALPGQVAGAEP